MSDALNRPRQPAAFAPDDPRLRRSAPEAEKTPAGLALERQAESLAPAWAAALTKPRGGIRWGGLLISAITGLLTLAAWVWLSRTVSGLISRHDWIGWLAMGLMALALLAALMLILREIMGLARLTRVTQLQHEAESILIHGGEAKASAVTSEVKSLLAGRKELAWAFARLRPHEADIMDGRERLALTERELIGPLDAEARALIAVAARRVSVVTALSPSALLDVLFVAAENLRMLRRIATLYGGRPGFLGLMRLARLVLGHLALTGGMALGDGLLHQLAGHGLTARLSTRLGEGLVNGAFTGRIGIAAVKICRPLPFIEAKPPRLRDLLAQLTRNGRDNPAGAGPSPANNPAG